MLSELVITNPSLLYFRFDAEVLSCSFAFDIFFLRVGCGERMGLFLDLDVLALVEFLDMFFPLDLREAGKWEVMELLRSNRWI